MAEIFARRALLELLAETSYNTWADPAGNIMWVENLKFTPMQTDSETDINICGDIGSQPQHHYNPRVPVEFDFYFRGVNTPGNLPHEVDVFRAGARAVTQTATEVTITTLDEGVDSASLRIHYDGDRYTATGLRGVISWSGKSEERLMFHFKGLANWRAAESGTFPTPACDALAAYPALRMNSSASCQYFGLSPQMIDVSTSYGADARFENPINHSPEIIVDDRNLSATINFRSIAIADGRNWDNDVAAGHTDGVAWSFGTESGKIVEITWPNCQINSNDPTGTDGSKRTTGHELSLRSDASGNDEIIVFK